LPWRADETIFARRSLFVRPKGRYRKTLIMSCTERGLRRRILSRTAKWPHEWGMQASMVLPNVRLLQRDSTVTEAVFGQSNGIRMRPGARTCPNGGYRGREQWVLAAEG
jgi:hypothetical protein